MQTLHAAKRMLAEIAPRWPSSAIRCLFGDIWERPQLSKRDRSLITCTALVALGKTEQMTTHFPRAIQNGVTQEELIDMITPMASTLDVPAP